MPLALRPLVALALLVVPWLSLAAPSVARPLEELGRDHWTTRDGLPHNSVNAIAQTPEGYLWFATWEGLVRYNGQAFTVLDRRDIPVLHDAALRALHVDTTGRLVVGGARGTLARLTLDGRWDALPRAPEMVTQIGGDEAGRLWVGTETSGLLHVDRDGSTRLVDVPAHDAGSNFGVARDAYGRWWAAHAVGLRVVDGERLQPPNAVGLPPGPATAVVADGSRLWMGSARGVYYTDLPPLPTEEPLRFRRLDSELDGVGISRLLPDGRGGLWIGTLKDGLMRWTPRGLERLGVGPDRPSARILALFIDRESNLWVGSNGGLFRFTDLPFANLTRREGLPDDFVRSVLARADGSTLVGTAQGLAESDARGRVRTLGAGTALEGASILSLADAGPRGVWVGTYDQGALLWDGRGIAGRVDGSAGLPANEVRAMAVDGDALWLGTTRGLARWDGRGVQVWTRREGLPADFVIALHLDRRGRLWVGTGTGARRMVDGQLRELDLAAFEDGEYAFGFMEDVGRDHVWVASDRGLLRFDGEGRPTGAVGLAAGLPFEKVFGALRDGEDQLWASGNRGVLRIDLAHLNAVADGAATGLQAERFTEVDGMASAQGNGGSQPVIALDRAGRRWFATAAGAARVHPADLARHARAAPPVVIESVRADGRRMALPGRAPVVLPAGTGRLEVRYAGLAFALPERLRYRHRLAGFDAGWIERGPEGLAEYTGLPPGRYVFEVEAAHPRGAWGESRASVVIELPRLWWQQPLLQGLAALALVTLVVTLWRWRVRRIAANERRLERLVEERTTVIEQQTARLRFQADEFARQARQDPLTAIANRRAFDEALGREYARSRRGGAAMCIALVDIDHFKAINDRHSHAVGDEVLKRVAAHLQSACRGFDLVARWGGEEFALLLPETTRPTARAICERLRASLAALDFGDLAQGLRITASFGVADAAQSDDRHRLLQEADEALYRAKANGRNRVEG